MTSREPTDAPTRATTLVRDDASHRRRLLAFWKHGSVTFDLPESGTVTVGRGRDCDVNINHPSVSRNHARFHLGRRVAVEDVGSSNGTVVGGRAIARGEIAAVEPGVVIEVGSAMLLVQGGDADRAAIPVGEMTPRRATTTLARAPALAPRSHRPVPCRSTRRPTSWWRTPRWSGSTAWPRWWPRARSA